MKATLVPSGEVTGKLAPVLVMALRDGTEGNSQAVVVLTTSGSMVIFLDQGTKPSSFISTVYSPGARFMRSLVMVLYSPFTYTLADSGYDSAFRMPVALKPPVSISGRYPLANLTAKMVPKITTSTLKVDRITRLLTAPCISMYFII